MRMLGRCIAYSEDCEAAVGIGERVLEVGGWGDSNGDEAGGWICKYLFLR